MQRGISYGTFGTGVCWQVSVILLWLYFPNILSRNTYSTQCFINRFIWIFQLPSSDKYNPKHSKNSKLGNKVAGLCFRVDIGTWNYLVIEAEPIPTPQWLWSLILHETRNTNENATASCTSATYQDSFGSRNTSVSSFTARPPSHTSGPIIQGYDYIYIYIYICSQHDSTALLWAVYGRCQHAGDTC